MPKKMDTSMNIVKIANALMRTSKASPRIKSIAESILMETPEHKRECVTRSRGAANQKLRATT